MKKYYIFFFMLLSLCILKAEEASLPVDSAVEEELVIIEDGNTPNIAKSRFNKEELYAQAPNFYAYQQTGQIVSLNAYAGKIILLDFWTTYDRYCLKSIKPLNELQDKYGRKGLVVLAVSIDNPENVRKGDR